MVLGRIYDDANEFLTDYCKEKMKTSEIWVDIQIICNSLIENLVSRFLFQLNN